MASIFNALHIGYSGLNAAQVGIDTVGHNISNAETEGYTRQRVVTSAAYPLGVDPGQRGTGTQITEIARVFDKFVNDRYTSAAQNKEYSDTLKKNLEELSTYFPEVDGAGIKNDLQNYFDSWQTLASNPSNTAVKVALAEQAQTLATHIGQTRTQIAALQSSLNDQIAVDVNEVNRIGEQIAGLNKSIYQAESSGTTNANDLRDQRDQLEMTLSKLIGSKAFSDKLQANAPVDTSITTQKGNYTVNIGGFNIIDGTSFHPIGVDATGNKNGYNDLYYERQDGVRIPFTSSVGGGKIGALLELRGSKIDSAGNFENGFLQETLNTLDTFTKGLIQSTNNLYAQGATATMNSNPLSLDDTQPLLSSGENFKAGTFDVVAYDINGKEIARRPITINAATVMDNASATNLLSDGITPNSIVEQLKAMKDDNNDSNGLNDIGNMIESVYIPSSKTLSLDVSKSFASLGVTFAIEDKGTNFAGVTGMSRFFDGNDGRSITLNSTLRSDPTLIKGSKSPVSGDNRLAMDMGELQFTKIDFANGSLHSNETIYGYFDSLVTKVGTKTNSVIQNNQSVTAQFNAIKQEQDSIGKVALDEEMANLIRYQTSYGAAAKVITTIDQMMTTLLGIKN